MKKATWKSTPNAVYAINDHRGWSTTYRKPVLVPPVEAALKDLLTQTAAEHGDDVLGLAGLPDHVHVFQRRQRSARPSAPKS